MQIQQELNCLTAGSSFNKNVYTNAHKYAQTHKNDKYLKLLY